MKYKVKLDNPNKFEFQQFTPKKLAVNLGAAIKTAATIAHTKNEFIKDSNSRRCCISKSYNNSYNISYITNTTSATLYTIADWMEYFKDYSSTHHLIDVHLFIQQPKEINEHKAGYLDKFYTSIMIAQVINHTYINQMLSSVFDSDMDNSWVLTEQDLLSSLKNWASKYFGKSVDIKNYINGYWKDCIEYAGSFEDWYNCIANNCHELIKVIEMFYNDSKSYWKTKFTPNEITYSDREISDYEKFKYYENGEYKAPKKRVYKEYFLDIHEYGSKRQDQWKCIKSRNGKYCLFLINSIKSELANIYNIKGSKWTKQWLFGEILCGPMKLEFNKWFNLEEQWISFRKALTKVTPSNKSFDESMVEFVNYIDQTGMKELMEESSMPIKVNNLINTIESQTLPDFDVPVAVEPQVIEPHIDTNTDQEMDNTDEDLDFEALKAEGKLIQQSTSSINTNDNNNEDDTDFFNDIKKRYGND